MELREGMENSFWLNLTGVTSPVIVLITAFCVIMFKVKKGKKEENKYIIKLTIFIAILVWALFYFFISPFLYKFNGDMWNVLKRFIILISLLVAVIMDEYDKFKNVEKHERYKLNKYGKRLITTFNWLTALNAISLACSVLLGELHVGNKTYDTGTYADYFNDLLGILNVISLAVATIALRKNQ